VVLKSHGIHELEALSTVFRDPQASFIVLQRNPMDSAPSYRQLRKSCFAALTLGLNLASTAWKPLLDLQIESDVAYFQEEKRVLENEFAETKVKYQVQAVEQGRFKQTPATKLLRAGTWRGFPMAAVLYENLLIDRGQRVFEALFDAFGVGHRYVCVYVYVRVSPLLTPPFHLAVLHNTPYTLLSRTGTFISPPSRTFPSTEN
jgi:hypothetical protein